MQTPVSARVTGFEYTTHHAYTTEVAADGRSWRLALRYAAFYRFYADLLALEPQFRVPFPPKGGLFFSPRPDERQQQLDDFVQNTLTFFDLRGRPEPMGKLLDDLLEVSAHLDAPTDADKEIQSIEEEEVKEPSVVGGLLNSKWAKALVSVAMQAVVVNTFQENVEAGKGSRDQEDDVVKGKAVDALDVDTPASPASRASLTKTPRQSATVAPLAVSSPFDTPTKTETKVETKAETKVETKSEKTNTEVKSKLEVETKTETKPVEEEAKSVVRSRVALWERRASSPPPRAVGQRSSSCSSAGDQAPVMPLTVLDTDKSVVKAPEVVNKVEKVDKMDGKVQEMDKLERQAQEVDKVEQQAQEVDIVKVEVEVEVEVEPTEEIKTVVEKEKVETTAEVESEGYESDASVEMRRLGLVKLDVSERLRFYRHPVFFQGFYCDVRTSLVADRA